MNNKNKYTKVLLYSFFALSGFSAINTINRPNVNAAQTSNKTQQLSNNQKAAEQSDFVTNMSTSIRDNDLVNDKTNSNIITVSVFEVQGYQSSKGKVVVSFDKSNGNLYAMKSTNGNISNRIQVTNNYQTLGFGNKARIRLTNGGKNYQLISNGTNNLNRQRSFNTKNYNTYSGNNKWFNNYYDQLIPQKQKVTVHYIDKNTKKDIVPAKTFEEYGGHNYETSTSLKPGTGYVYDSSTNNVKGYISTKDITINNYYTVNRKPNINDAKTDDTTVKGTGNPGDTVIITDSSGKELGKGTVGDDGTFTADLDRPLKEGEKITATSQEDKNSKTDVTVSYDAEAHKPTVDETNSGDKTVSGTGVAGDKITITDADGNKLGETTVGDDGKYNTDINRPLKDGETITATPETDGNAGTPADSTVKYNPDYHKADLDSPKGGAETVTGTGIAGDKITITDSTGQELGTGTVGDDGKFSISTNRPLKDGETITATPSTKVDGEEQEGTKSTADVQYNEEAHKPNIDKAHTGDSTVTGTGVPGDTITITDADGNKLGDPVQVGDDGKFTADLNKSLEDGQTITATPETDGNKGTPTDVTVDYVAEDHKPTIDKTESGSQTVTGEGTKGDKIIITDKDGNKLGETTVDNNGKYTANLDRPLKSGETITATPETNGNKGTSTDAEVDYNETEHKPNIDKAHTGDTNVSGTGVPGDTITITDKETGEPLGDPVQVGPDGHFDAKLDKPLEEGQTVTATSDDGNDHKASTDVTVDYIADDHKPYINETKPGDKVVTGTGVPGDDIKLTDDNGKEIGHGTVDKDGKFDITLDEGESLKEGGTVTATPVTGDNEGTSATAEVGFNQEAHKPKVDKANGGDKVVTGTGVAGDKITITDADGNKLGEATVGEDGKFTVSTNRPLKDGETITATPDTDGKVGQAADKKVDYDATSHQPNVDKPAEGDKTISGTGVPGDKVVVTDKDGNQIGTGTVDQDGNFTADLDKPLNKGEEVTVTPETNGNKGTPTEVVTGNRPYVADEHKPVVDSANGGDKVVTGNGIPGDKITITDQDGKKLGEATVGNDGKFTVSTNHPLKDGETITATPNTDGKKGPTTDKKVDYNANAHKPVVETPTEGDKTVSGTGVPGDKVIVTDQDGNQIGTGTVGDDGKFTADLDKPLNKGDKVTVTPETDGNKGTPTDSVTGKDYVASEHKPVIDSANGGDKVVTGNGIPGDKIIINDVNGKELGSATVGNDGKFTVSTNRPLKDGETITGIPVTDGQTGTTADKKVDYNANAHKPVVETPTEGDKTVSGTGVPGDKVIVTDQNGNQIGTGTVDKNGNFTADLDKPLNKGDKVNVTPETDGNKGTPTDVTTNGNNNNNSGNNNTGNSVNSGNNSSFNPTEHKPQVNVPTEGDSSVTGSGKPGDKVIITDQNGNQIGTGTVGNDGKFDVNLNKPLNKGDKVTVTPETNGNKGTASTVGVNNKQNNTNINGNGNIKKNTVVYSLKPIYLYKNTTFNKAERKEFYARKPRINRPMFVVTNVVKNKNGRIRYQVKDVNHLSKTDGMTGYITAKKDYVLPVYYYGKHNTVTVINPKGVNAYKNKNLTKKAKNYKQGTVLKLTKVVKHNLTTRYQLSNGTYITANKKLVKMGKLSQVKRVKTKHAINIYKTNGLKHRVLHVKKGRTIKVKDVEYSNPDKMNRYGNKVYKVAGGYITANSKYVKAYK